MDTITAITERRSVKHFDPEHRFSETEISALLELALLSPTSFNMQNWRFVVVTDPAKQDELYAAAWNQAQVREASATILLCAHLKAHENGERYWTNAPAPVQEALIPMISKFYEDNHQLQRDEAMRSIGIAAQTIMVAAKAIGYDTCPMIGFDPAKVGSIIKLPEDHLVGMMIAAGKAVKDANARGGQLDYDEVVFRDEFPAS